ARTFAASSVVWLAYPRWRWACALTSASVMVGLVGMNYHFVGDTIAGGFLGSVIGTLTVTSFGIREGVRSTREVGGPPAAPNALPAPLMATAIRSGRAYQEPG